MFNCHHDPSEGKLPAPVTDAKADARGEGAMGPRSKASKWQSQVQRWVVCLQREEEGV